MKTRILLLALLLALPAQAAEEGARKKVDLPEMMKQHMLSNMRDHLVTLHEIHALLGRGELDKAGEVAETRLGMSSLVSHNAAHMAPYMPKEMQAVGTEMHHAASRFALTAKEGDLPRALESLSKVSAQCVACHGAFRLN